MDPIRLDPQQALLQPVASDDNEVLVVLRADANLDVLSTTSGTIILRLSLPKSIRQSVGEINWIRWSPESVVFEQDNSEVTRRWILLSFDTRVVVLSVDVVTHARPSQDQATILVDYQLETHLGKITFADFVISHEHILVIFETALHASMLSTTSPNRSDIPLPKFPDHRGIAQSPLRNSFALITKSKGQDNIAIFSSTDGVVSHPLVFVAGTSDVQGLRWAPNGDPIIAAWDTAAHGIKVVFFTALSHPLRKLELNHASFSDQAVPGTGINHLTWYKSAVHDTVLVISDGAGNTFLRAQNNRDMTTTTLSHFKQTSTADGSTYIVWQENDDHTFTQQEIALDLHFDATTTTTTATLNSTTTLLATRVTAHPKSLWIWQPGKPIPLAVLLFHNDIRQTTWHPTLPHVLVVTTHSKDPIYFIWHDVQLPPQPMQAHLPPTTHIVAVTSRLKVQWLSRQPSSRAPLLISNTRTFDIVILSRSQDQVQFTSLIRDGNMRDAEPFDDSTALAPDTPSKPGRRGGSRMLDEVTSRILPATDDEW